jgi:DNA-binding NarL/FixJ family response regulator
MKILVVDDHALFREGLVSLLSKQPDFTVIGEAASGHEAISKAALLEPDIVLMDIGLPDMDGLEAGKAILAQKPDTKIVMLTIHDTDDLLVNAIIYGAKDICSRTVPYP